MITVRSLRPLDTPLLTALQASIYQRQQKMLPMLPTAPLPPLDPLVQRELGVIAFVGGVPVGYLAPQFFMNEHFGMQPGLFCPVHGVAVTGQPEGKILSLLYQQASEKWVAAGYLSHAIALFDVQQQAQKTLVELGFGRRTVDMMARLPIVIEEEQHSYQLREIAVEERALVFPLEEALNRHLQCAPLFMPHPAGELVQFLQDVEEDGSRFFGAFLGKDLVAYLKVSPEGEQYITLPDSVANITGAYTLPAHRPEHVSRLLLGFVSQQLASEGYRYLGVDCETINSVAYHFWCKWFTPYVYGYHRRIDERILATQQL